MSIIEGAANHTVTSMQNGKKIEGPALDLSVDDINLVIAALSSGQQSALAALQRANDEQDSVSAADAFRGLNETSAVLQHLYSVAADDGTNIDGDPTKKGAELDPIELGTVVATLSALAHKTAAALNAVKRGEYTVVDVAEGVELEEGQVPLFAYNRVQMQSENAGPLGNKIAAYLREAYPEVIAVSREAFLKVASEQRDKLLVTEAGDTNAYAAMLDTAVMMFGLEWDILDGMVQAFNATKN